MTKYRTVIRHGKQILAKDFDGELTPVTYSNRSQAYKMAGLLGPEWNVYQWGRPFYVGTEQKEAQSC